MTDVSGRSGFLRGLALRFGPRHQVTDWEFLEPAREIVEAPLSPVRVALAIVICAIFTVCVAATVFGRVDIYAVAPGRIQPAGRTKVIEPMEDGKVIAIHVENGSHVSAGQVLAELDPTLNEADRLAAGAEQADLAGEIARRKAVVAAAAGRGPAVIDFPASVSPDIRDREQGVLTADLARLRTNLALLEAKRDENAEHIQALNMMLTANRQLAGTLSERVAMRRGLQQEGWDSRANVMDASEDLQKQQAEIVSEQGELLQAQAEFTTARREIGDTVAQFIQENVTALEAAENKFDSNSQALVKAQARLDHMRLVSPISGTVQQLEVTTIGQVVSTGRQLMTVVPDSAALEIEAQVKNDDIGFVRAGQRAVVKIQSFPFTRYGTLSGVVVRVSRDAVTSPDKIPGGDTEDKPDQPTALATTSTPPTQDLVYPVRVLLDQSAVVVGGKQVKLVPGMSVSVEIRTGRRRVISYIMSPLIKTVAESGHER